MTPGMTADSIVNLCGAIGLCVAMMTFYRRDPRSPLTSRLLVALGVIALLFLMRGTAWWTGSALLDRLTVVPAALIPLGALIVTEGMLRRHAPRAVKLAMLLGALLLALAGLLATRDRAALMASENRSVARLALGALLVMPFILTDFRTLFPNIPVRLGALGALLTVTVMLIAGGGAETRRHGLVLMALRLISSALLGCAAAFIAPDVDAAQLIRFCAVAIAGVLTIALMTDSLRALFESQEPGVLNSVAASPARGRDELIGELARHPIFESARRYREGELVAYDPPVLRDFLATRRVLRRPDAPWGLAATDAAVERIMSLMTAESATHVLVLSHDPVDLIALAVPVTSADPATETALALVRRLLVSSPEVAG